MSIVITTFNTGRYLPETLESVFAQSYGNFEVIVVDDGSTDDTLACARTFVPRITLVAREHAGLGLARNAGLARATGDYLAFLDSDDLWEPDALQVQLEVARRHPASGLIMSDGVEFDDGEITDPHLYPMAVAAWLDAAPDGEVTGWMYHDFLTMCPARCPAQAIMPRRVVDAIGDVCITPNGMQDYDYYLRIARRFPVTLHARSLVRRRYRAESMSGPRETRGLHLTMQTISVVQRGATTCPSEDRAAVRRAITHHVRQGCVEAARSRIEYGANPDPDALATLYRIRPCDPIVWWIRAAFALPAPFDRLALRSTRATRRAVRRLRSTVRR